MSKRPYRLVNPYIEGSFKTIVKAKNPSSAARYLYKNLSNMFTNHVKNFNFAIQNIETKGIIHFNVREQSKKGGSAIDFAIRKIPSDTISNETNDNLIKQIDDLESFDQDGGRPREYYDDDDSEFSTSAETESEYFREGMVIQPITKFTYFYLPYIPTVQTIKFVGINANDLNSLFMPTFSYPLRPIIQLRFELAS